MSWDFVDSVDVWEVRFIIGWPLKKTHAWKWLMKQQPARMKSSLLCECSMRTSHIILTICEFRECVWLFNEFMFLSLEQFTQLPSSGLRTVIFLNAKTFSRQDLWSKLVGKSRSPYLVFKILVAWIMQGSNVKPHNPRRKKLPYKWPSHGSPENSKLCTV